MNDFVFELSDWELALEKRKPGDSINAGFLLSMLDSEEEVRAAMDALGEKGVALDISDLPRIVQTGQSADRLAMEEELVKQENWHNALDENDPLSLYLQELAQIPVAGDPQTLALELVQGNREVMPRLADVLLAQVVAECTAFVGHGVLLSDLVQEGSLALWQGIGCYEGGDIEAHCRWWIRQGMAGAVLLQASQRGLGQKLRSSLEDYRDTDQRLLVELGRNPTVEEIAQHLHITVEEASRLEEQYGAAQSMARAKTPDKPAEEEPEQEQAVEDTAYFAMRQRIQELLSQLSEEDAKLLTLRYGLDGQAPMKPQQVAVKMGITPDEVVHREGQALALLRNRGS
ncbi:MAG: sigma-70 family RNA polymerase sigma factor [Oscillospiraceae bacterium]|nr:sigma-70 family RNA polymerase sigma factor [Oscillospiraceae bacterium]